MAKIAAPAADADRLRWIIDREEIRALVAEFGRSIDDKDQPSYAATFAVDGELVLPLGTFSGRASIASMHSPPPEVATHHLISNIVIEVIGDRAIARSYLLATHAFDARDKTQKAHSGGWYEQTLIRTPDGWRFLRVKLVIIWEDLRPMVPVGPNGDLPAKSPGVTGE